MRIDLMVGSVTIVFLTWALEGAAQEKAPPKKLPPLLQELAKKTPEELLAQFDKNQDKHLSQEELPPVLAKAFTAADRNRDGKLDRGEVVQLQDLLRDGLAPPAGDGDAFVNLLLKQFDANGDGKLAKTEARGKIADGFAKLDQNSDGFLDRTELRALGRLVGAQKKGPGGPGPFAVEADDFNALDRDADGRLTRAELKNSRWLTRFAEIDTNNDGRLDRREFEAHQRQPARKE